MTCAAHIMLAVVGVLLNAQPAREPPSPPGAENNPAQEEITADLNIAVQAGMDYLVARQGADGSFGGDRYGRDVAITALACLALMSDGNLPGRGPHGDAVLKGLEFILSQSAENGLLAGPTTNGPMYGHGFATLFLGEVYGMTQGGPETDLTDRVHDALVRAVRLIEGSQNDEGGWRYNPVPYDADVSVTICQVMGLRSARNAGIEVNKSVIDKAVAYVRRCQNTDGGFKYQADGGSSAWPRSAAGVATLFYAGIYEGDDIDRGLAYVYRSGEPGRGGTTKPHYFYGAYYSVQAMYLAGGDHWANWWPAVREELINAQTSDGAWQDRSVGSEYATAMALIVLQMPKRYLPIFQK